MPTLYPLMLVWCFITPRGNFSACHCTAYHALLAVACEYMMLRNSSVFLRVNDDPLTVPKLVGIMIVQHPIVGVIPSKSVTINSYV